MTQEEKTLLIQDLCSRLPYGVKIRIEYPFYEEKDMHPEDFDGLDLRRGVIANTSVRIEEIKPYLRPMSSMTEEEMGEYAKFKLSNDNDVYEFTDFRTTGKGFINVHTSCKNGGNGYTFQINNRTMLYDDVIGIDWLNKKHFDYRDLIEKGLALKAPGGMYNFK